MVICKECGSKTILASSGYRDFYPDREPFRSGKEEYSGCDEIDLVDFITVHIQWCPKCDKAISKWIED